MVVGMGMRLKVPRRVGILGVASGEGWYPRDQLRPSLLRGPKFPKVKNYYTYDPPTKDYDHMLLFPTK